MDLGLAGKVVLITGGSGGIGGPAARAFAAEGARVALTFHRHETIAEKVAHDIRRCGGEALVVPYDLGNSGSIRAAIDSVTTCWSCVDVLVAAASPAGGPSLCKVSFEDVPIERWQGQMRSEVEGAFHTVQAVLPWMKRGGWGRIVFLSASVVSRGTRGDEAYIASKMALHGLNRTLATELYADGVLTNVVAPGPTFTPGLLVRIPDEIRKILAGKPAEQVKKILNQEMPHLRFSTIEDVTSVILFLASAANGNVTGSVVNVAGGQ